MDSTRYAVFSRLFAEIFDYEPPSSGISFKKLFGQITDRLVEEDEVLAVALDDVNYLFYESEACDTLYSLLRAHETHSGAKIGVIYVSSDLELDTIDDLDTRVQSVFARKRCISPVRTGRYRRYPGRSADRGSTTCRRPHGADRVAELTEERAGTSGSVSTSCAGPG